MSRLLIACGWIAMCLLAATTHQRSEVWQSNKSLWADAAAKAPLRPRAFINLGIEHELAGDLNAASQAYLAAIALSQQDRLSAYSRAFHRAAGEVNNARVMARAGHPGIAIALLDEVIARHPQLAHARYQKGVILVSVGLCAEGLDVLRELGDGFPRVTCQS